MRIAYDATLLKIAATRSHDGTKAAEGEIGGVRRGTPGLGNQIWKPAFKVVPSCRLIEESTERGRRQGGVGNTHHDGREAKHRRGDSILVHGAREADVWRRHGGAQS